MPLAVKTRASHHLEHVLPMPSELEVPPPAPPLPVDAATVHPADVSVHAPPRHAPVESQLVHPDVTTFAAQQFCDHMPWQLLEAHCQFRFKLSRGQGRKFSVPVDIAVNSAPTGFIHFRSHLSACSARRASCVATDTGGTTASGTARRAAHLPDTVAGGTLSRRSRI